MKYKAIIFDLDGTLINSIQDIAICANKTLETLNLPTHEIENYKYFVGDGARVLIQNAMPKHTPPQIIEEALKTFTKIYEKNIHSNTYPYDGIYKLLDNLENCGINKAILTNKHHEFALRYVEKLFSSYNFKEVYGQIDELPKKPDPFLAHKIMNNLNLQPHEVVFVGDTATDMLTAINAGFDSIGVLWGFRDEEELVTHGATYIASEPNDIFNILKN